jgi:hypothetical protein
MRVAGSNCRTRAFLLGKMATEVALGEEFVLVYVGDRGLRRCEIALLRREEAGLVGYVDLGGRSSRRMRSRPATRSRGRESKVDSIREESVYHLPLVTVLYISGNGGLAGATLGTAKRWSYHELWAAQGLNKRGNTPPRDLEHVQRRREWFSRPNGFRGSSRKALLTVKRQRRSF